MFNITGTPKQGDIKAVAANLDTVLPDKIEKVEVPMPTIKIEDDGQAK